MRAFLSHSSKDKGYVESVAALLKPGTFELDSETFDAGLINATVISKALKRSDLFCLFLSTDSVQAPYVTFETLLGAEFFAKGQIDRFLAVCIDEGSFSDASENVKFFSIVKRCSSVESAAWLIQGALVSAASSEERASHPFIGREEALRQLESQVTSTERPAQRALFVSGNFGTGRRTLVRKFFQNQFPQVGQAFPMIRVDELDGLDELHRKVLAAVRPAMTARELSTRIGGFSAADKFEKARQVADLLGSLLSARESSFLLDAGGILDDAGAMQAEISLIIDQLADRPHPATSIISPRMVPSKKRREAKDVAYIAVDSLTRDESLRLAKGLLRKENVSATDEQISELIDLSDQHPYNFYAMIEEIREHGLALFLAQPGHFIEWKHRQSSEYLKKVNLFDTEVSLLGLLKLLPTLDFEAMVGAMQLDAADTATALMRLSQLHIVEHSGDEYTISPPLRIAVERDRRIDVPESKKKDALSRLADSLAVRLDEGTASISLIDSAVISAIESAKETYAAAFLLPSHYVWLAKRKYDQKQYSESIRLAKEALKSIGRLSSAAVVAGCRFMCLAAARIGDGETFDVGIKRLSANANDNWSKSNVEFLRGFNQRMKGHQPSAEDHFRNAYKLSPGNYSIARELAAICLARGNLLDAEQYAREAHNISSSNPYVLDILLALLTRKLKSKAKENAEVRHLLDVLQQVGDEGGRSFYTTRLAEIELVSGERREARILAERAISRTPNIFEPRRIYVEVCLAEGNFTKAREVLDWMKSKVNATEPGERRTNYRAYLECNAHYLTEIGQYSQAKEIYHDNSVFSEDERGAGVREIELVQMARHRI